MINLNDFRENHFHFFFVVNQFCSVLCDKSNEKLYVCAHERLVIFSPILRHQERFVYFDVLLVCLLLELQEDSKNLNTEIQQITFCFESFHKKVEDNWFQIWFWFWIVFNDVKRNIPQSFKNKLNRTEIIIRSSFEKLHNDWLLVLKKLVIERTQIFWNVIEHFCQTLNNPLLFLSSFIYDPQNISSNWSEWISFEEKCKITEVKKISMP